MEMESWEKRLAHGMQPGETSKTCEIDAVEECVPCEKFFSVSKRRRQKEENLTNDTHLEKFDYSPGYGSAQHG